MVKRAKGALLQSIVLDRASPQGLSGQIGVGLRTLILEGVLRPGERLPASRILARELGVARATIVETFEQLQSEGLLQTRVGSGTFVAAVLAVQRPLPPPLHRAAPSAPVRLSSIMEDAAARLSPRLQHKPMAFTTAMPAFDAFPMARWSSLAARHWRKPPTDILGYPEPSGFAPLRHAIAAHLRTNRGIACEPGQVFVTGGAQQAFQVIAQMLLDPGDAVWFEDPGAIGARNALVMGGARIVPVPVDDQGLDVAAARRLAPDARLVFVTPAHQQPLGAKMSLERRFALQRAAEDAGAWIVEDDWDGEFCFSGQPQPPLKGIDAGDRVIYVGTFSKSLFPALRLGFVVAPQALVGPFALALRAFAPSAPLGHQATLADFIGEGDFAAHVRRMRKLYAERHQALQRAVAGHLGPWLDFVPTNTGLHAIAHLAAGLDGRVVAAAALERGVVVTPVEAFALRPLARSGLVLGFAAFSPAQIDQAASILADVFRDFEREAGGERRRA
jgi:GntR family transcriptional regulator / MocR family aminotransferase